MRKQVILIMQGSVYPFGQADESPSKSKSNARILVRKKHETRSLQQRNQLLDKIQVVKSINNAYIMRIETVLEEQNSTHVLYEYVPNCLLKQINSLTQNDINQIRDNLLDLAVSLADAGLRADWDSRNIGLNDKNQAKYYLDLDRVGMDKVSSRSKLQREHFKVIMDLFAQFVNSSQKPKQNPRNSGSNSRKTEITQSQQSSIINARAALTIENKAQLHNLKQQIQHQGTTTKPPILNHKLQKPQVPPSKQKEQQKQRLQMKNSRTNWKQLDHNQQFMKDFINVLDDKSQNAQSKYVSDEEQEQQHQREEEQVEAEAEGEGEEDDDEENYEQKEVDADEHEQEVEYEEDEQEEEIIWVSAPDGGEQLLKSSEEEQVVWVDHREFANIRQRAEEAIQRSTKVLQTFKLILAKNKRRV